MLAMRNGFCAGEWLRVGLVVLLGACFGLPVVGQTVPTTTVQGTVYLANGRPGSGTVLVSWPAFTTAVHQQVAAGSTAVTVGSDGFLSVNLAANLGSNPAGLYYTAVFHLSDGTVNTQFRCGIAAGLFGIFGGGSCEPAVECECVKAGVKFERGWSVRPALGCCDADDE
jgi:hypothetical protein